MEQAKHELIILQPTTFCNLNCRYCWLPEKHLDKRMSHETFRLILKRIVNAADRLVDKPTLLWHGGEPLAMGVDYYRQCLEDLNRVCQEHGISLQPSIQTNATLINEAWIDLFKTYNVKLGISVDGPAWLHDQGRTRRNGKGSHAAVERGIELLKNAGIEFSIIAVVSNVSLDHADELYDYFRDLNIKVGVGFNIEENEGVHANSSVLSQSADRDLMYEKVKRFFSRLFERNEQEDRKVIIREFEKYYPFVDGLAQMGQDFIYNSMMSPGAIITIDYAGNLSTFCPELFIGQQGDNPFVFGNVKTHDFDSIEKDERYFLVADAIMRGREKCRAECDYYMVCGGSSASNKYYENKAMDTTETLHCRYQIKAVGDAVLDYMEARSLSQPHSLASRAMGWLSSLRRLLGRQDRASE